MHFFVSLHCMGHMHVSMLALSKHGLIQLINFGHAYPITEFCTWLRLLHGLGPVCPAACSCCVPLVMHSRL